MSDTSYFSTETKAADYTLLKNVYLGMTAGLSLTAATAWWTVRTPAVFKVLFGCGAFGCQR